MIEMFVGMEEGPMSSDITDTDDWSWEDSSEAGIIIFLTQEAVETNCSRLQRRLMCSLKEKREEKKQILKASTHFSVTELQF
jgi:hypothetical protein